MTMCITPFDQWDTFSDVTHQNITRNRTGVVAEILCVAGPLSEERHPLCLCTHGHVLTQCFVFYTENRINEQ